MVRLRAATSNPPLPASPKDMRWKQSVLNLSPYAGQTTTVEFRVSNRPVAVDNTWIYLDNINMIYRESVTHNTFIPVIFR
jgi:hypothetical protein